MCGPGMLTCPKSKEIGSPQGWYCGCVYCSLLVMDMVTCGLLVMCACGLLVMCACGLLVMCACGLLILCECICI